MGFFNVFIMQYLRVSTALYWNNVEGRTWHSYRRSSTSWWESCMHHHIDFFPSSAHHLGLNNLSRCCLVKPLLLQWWPWACSLSSMDYLCVALVTDWQDDKAATLGVCLSPFSLCSLIFSSQCYTPTLRYLGLDSSIQEQLHSCWSWHQPLSVCMCNKNIHNSV